ncbi:unnamed protein product [Porites lobata]|uniref:COX assembly mitochondrial protein n=1 Tax=Porites lobata TaxID=104759 RepID=A0ABN8NSY7_9CNID|nr:unnamed protein product [Porites lobata]
MTQQASIPLRQLLSKDLKSNTMFYQDCSPGPLGGVSGHGDREMMFRPLSGTRKACNTESEMKSRNLTEVDSCGELFARLTNCLAEMRRNNKIKAAASASSRLGW